MLPPNSFSLSPIYLAAIAKESIETFLHPRLHHSFYTMASSSSFPPLRLPFYAGTKSFLISSMVPISLYVQSPTSRVSALPPIWQTTDSGDTRPARLGLLGPSVHISTPCVLPCLHFAFPMRSNSSAIRRLPPEHAHCHLLPFPRHFYRSLL